MARYPYQSFIQDGNGRAIESVTVTVYDADTTTLATIYAAKSGGSAISGSYVTTSASGYFIFYVDAPDWPNDTLLDIVPTKSGYQFDTIEDVAIYGEGDSNFYYPEYGAADQGATGDSNTVKYYVDTIGTTNKATIYLQHNDTGEFTDYSFGTAETVPSNITLKFEPGARIAVATGVTVTINGDILSGLNQIFSLTGTGAIAGLKESNSAWYGTGLESSVDASAAITTTIQNNPLINAVKQIDQFGAISEAAMRLILSSLLYGGRYVVTSQSNITSSSTVTAGTGAKTFTIDAGLPLQATEYVYMCKNVDPYYSLGGTITSYNATTGVLVLNVDANGLGTESISDWFLVAGGPALGVFQYQGSTKGPSMGIYAQIASSRRDPFNQPIAIYSDGGSTTVLCALGDGSIGFGTEAPNQRLHIVGTTGATAGDATTGIRTTLNLATNRGIAMYPDVAVNRVVSYDWDGTAYYPMSWDASTHTFVGNIIGNPKFGAGSTHVGTTGGLTRYQVEATETMSGASTTITLNIPVNCRLLGTQLRVDTLIESAVGVSWSAAYVTGSTTSLATGQAFTKNTKVNKMHVDEVTTDTTNIVITPNAGTFTAGVVRAIVYYESLTAMADA